MKIISGVVNDASYKHTKLQFDICLYYGLKMIKSRIYRRYETMYSDPHICYLYVTLNANYLN